MKLNYFKHLFTALLLMCSTLVFAEEVTIDGIKYDVVTKAKVATVISGGNYSGDIVIPESIEYNGVTCSVTSIGDYAFESCFNLTSIVIPNSVTSIGGLAFGACHNLVDVHISDLAVWCKINFSPFYSNPLYYAKNLYLNGELVTELVIPDSVTGIGEYVFQGCSSLVSVEIPNSVTSIGYGAFNGCSGLRSIVIPNSVTSIGFDAFKGCSSITSVTIGGGVKYIDSNVFAECENLIDVYCLAAEVPTTEENVFNNSYPEYMILHVPAEAVDSYKSTSPWKNFGNIVELNNTYELNVTSAGYATLYLDYAVEIPEGVEVYIAKAVEGELLKMQLVENIIPANTGVIVKAAAGIYAFYATYESAPVIAQNLFNGSVVDKNVKVPSGTKAYVLSMVDGDVGMYIAELTNGEFLNNANKAYLLLGSSNLVIYDETIDTSAGAQLSNGYRFDFNGITGVDNIAADAFTDAEDIYYNLIGCAVKVPTNGIYIVDGRKVLVK